MFIILFRFRSIVLDMLMHSIRLEIFGGVKDSVVMSVSTFLWWTVKKKRAFL